MINVPVMRKLLELDGNGCIDFAYLTGNYEYSFQREKVLEVLYHRCFGIEDDFSLVAMPGGMSIDGNEIVSEDMFGEYMERYVTDCSDNIYFKTLRRLEKYGKLWEASVFNDEVIDLASLEDAQMSPEFEATVRSMDHVYATLPYGADVDGFKMAFPTLQTELADWFCFDPLEENGSLMMIAYESEVIGSLFGFDTDDVALIDFRETLTNRFLGFNSNVTENGKFFMYVIYGNMEDQFSTIEDMSDAFIGQIAFLETLISKHASGKVFEFNKEEKVCKAA